MPLSARSVWLCLLLVAGMMGLVGCDLEKDVTLRLPPHRAELLTEAYFFDNTEPRLSLTLTSPFFDSLGLTLPRAVCVLLGPGGEADTLSPILSFDPATRRLYTHRLGRPYRLQVGSRYRLVCQDDSGRRLEGEARAMPAVPIDSVRFSGRPGDTLFLAQVFFTDLPGRGNYYRLIINRDSLTGGPTYDGLLTDNLREGGTLPVTTGYDYPQGSRLFVRLYHIEPATYEYLRSVREARQANGNPFAQPAPVRSSLTSGVGVFALPGLDSLTLLAPRP